MGNQRELVKKGRLPAVPFPYMVISNRLSFLRVLRALEPGLPVLSKSLMKSPHGGSGTNPMAK